LLVPFAPVCFPIAADRPATEAGHYDYRECINEFDDDVIFEEGSTGIVRRARGKVEIAKMNGASKTVITRSARAAPARWLSSTAHPARRRRLRRAKHSRDADQPCPFRSSGQPAAGLCFGDHGRACKRRASITVASDRGQFMSERRPSLFKTLLDSDVCTLIEAARSLSIRFKNRAANAIWCVRSRTTRSMSGYPRTTCIWDVLNHIGVKPDDIDMVALEPRAPTTSAQLIFPGRLIAAHRLAANKIMLRDDSRCCARCSTSRTCRSISISAEEGN
jgi:hypothetical protein